MVLLSELGIENIYFIDDKGYVVPEEYVYVSKGEQVWHITTVQNNMKQLPEKHLQQNAHPSTALEASVEW